MAFELDRKEEVISVRIRMGHTLFIHKSLFRNKAVKKCSQCDTNITIKDIIDSCTLHTMKKENILGLKFKYDNVKKDRELICNQLFLFIKEINFYLI